MGADFPADPAVAAAAGGPVGIGVVEPAGRVAGIAAAGTVVVAVASVQRTVGSP